MIARYIAVLLALIASSSDAGFRFVQALVKIQKWIEAHL